MKNKTIKVLIFITGIAWGAMIMQIYYMYQIVEAGTKWYTYTKPIGKVILRANIPGFVIIAVAWPENN